jgi:glucose-1-phosphatase
MRRRPALIFDFGNVVAHFDYARACAALGEPRGLTGPELLDRARGRGLDPLVRAFESGRLTAEAFSSEARRLLGLETPHEEFAAAWADIFWLNEPVARLIADLKSRGYTLVLGSNTNDLHAAQFRCQFAATLAHFDALVLSFELGQLKPSASFYQACATAAGAAPGDCVFIDDLPENIDGARAAGLKGLLFRDVPMLVEELQRLGVECTGRD